MKICNHFGDTSEGGRRVLELGPGAGALTQVRTGRGGCDGCGKLLLLSLRVVLLVLTFSFSRENIIFRWSLTWHLSYVGGGGVDAMGGRWLGCVAAAGRRVQTHTWHIMLTVC